MKYKVQLVEDQSPLAAKIADSYGFWHNPDFMSAVARLHQVDAYQVQVFKGEELIALLPVYERRKLGIKALVTPTASYYQGISYAFESNINPARRVLDTVAITSDIAEFLSSRYRRINLKLTPQNYDVRGFSWGGYRAKPLYTFREYLDQELSPMADERKKLRMAKGAGMYLGEDFDAESFIRLQRDLEKRKSFNKGVSYPALMDFYRELHEHGLLRQFNIYYKNEIVSANIILSDGGELAYTIILATQEDAMKLGAATLHSVELSRHLPSTTKILDFCGANIREVARFKAALGLDLRVYYHISI
jgi:hypothetical protein